MGTQSALVYDFLDVVLAGLLENYNLSISVNQSSLSKRGRLFHHSKFLWTALMLASVFYIVTPLTSMGAYLSMFFEGGQPEYLFIVRSVTFGIGVFSLGILMRKCLKNLTDFKSTSKFLVIESLVLLMYWYTSLPKANFYAARMH